MTKPAAVATSDYLNRPLRTITEVERDMSRIDSARRRLLMSIPFLRENAK